MLPLYVFNKLCAKCHMVLTLGQIKLTFGNLVFLNFRMILETCHAFF